MIKLDALKFEKVWGYELWLASTHENGLQKDFLEYSGGEYPLLVKIINADERLSVQVHPDDECAVALEGAGNVGKTECWYVLDAKPGAKLVYGMDGERSPEELSGAIKSNSLEKYLNEVPVKKGDFVFIPSGTVHAIGGGLRLLEVQQSCDLTYRLYDWGRPREVHIEKGLKAIKKNPLAKVSQFGGSFECEYFSLEEIKISGAYSAFNSGEKKNPRETILFFVLEGSGRVKGGERDSEDSAEKILKYGFNAEDIFALGGKEKIIFMAEGARIMKISCGQK